MTITGLHAWRWQRYSAIFLAFSFPSIALKVLGMEFSSRGDLIQLLQTPWFFAISIASMSLLGVHLWVGLRDITLDYLHDSQKTSMLAVIRVLIVAFYVWTALIAFWVLRA